LVIQEKEVEAARGALMDLEVEPLEPMEEDHGGASSKQGVSNPGRQTGMDPKKASEIGKGGGVKGLWRWIKETVKGKILVQDKEEGCLVVKEREGEERKEEDRQGEGREIEDWLLESEGGEIEIVEEKVEYILEQERSVDGSIRTGRSEEDAFSFLDGLEEEKKDKDAERIRSESLKRKRGGSEFTLNTKGLLGKPGWEEREERTKEDSRWKRTVSEGGKTREEPMPLPDTYRLGLDGRGLDLNSSGRLRHNMGSGKQAIFPKGGNLKGEDRNWVATFTKSGCIACRTEGGDYNHKGRSSTPVILVIGDEAAPTVLGYTAGKEEEETCGWVFKKEHLQLSEVAGILRRINKEKQEHDREKGKRPHEFFIPNGSKILVGSYTHLRKEGLEGYVGDFNNMVKDVWNVTGDTGIEVLPFCPVVFDGIDRTGGLLISGLKDWIRWTAEVKDRTSVSSLAETGGREEDEEGEQATFFYKPAFAVLQSKVKEKKDFSLRGNMVAMVRGERREVVVQEARPAKEIFRLVNRGSNKREGEKTEEERKREGFEEGPSMEAEYTFAKAVENFAREAVKEGCFGGTYRLNIKEQMRVRVRKVVDSASKVRVVTIGASIVKHIRSQMESMGEGRIELGEHIEVRGKLDRAEGLRVEARLAGVESTPDKILIGGPGNSMVEHGKVGQRGMRPERIVKVVRGQDGEVERLASAFHLTEPTRLTMCERRVVAGTLGRIIRQCRDQWPLVDIYYQGMFPRHVTKCCEERGHMTKEDTQVIDRSRRDLEDEIRQEFGRTQERVEVIEWYEAFGLTAEPTIDWTVTQDIVCRDGVHLNRKAIRRVSASLYCRLTESEGGDGGVKRMRLSL